MWGNAKISAPAQLSTRWRESAVDGHESKRHAKERMTEEFGLAWKDKRIPART